MHEVYDRWPEMAYDAYNSDLEEIHFENINHIVFAGMGGSGTVGDLFSAILSKTATHVTVTKGYMLPRTVNDDTLIVCTSVSGNTAETTAVVEAASRTGCKIVCFSSGGMIERFCHKNSIQFRRVDLSLNPRSSLPSYIYSTIKTLGPILPISKNDIVESLDILSSMRQEIGTDCLDSNPSVELARCMRGVLLAYYPWGLQAAAIRFKNSIQENMKMHAMTEDIIEACHNGIVAWERSSDIMPVIIRGRDDHAKTIERWNVIKEFFEQENITYMEVDSGKGSILSKLISLIYRLDFATIYGAVLQETDPVPVPSIDFVKKRTGQ